MAPGPAAVPVSACCSEPLPSCLPENVALPRILGSHYSAGAQGAFTMTDIAPTPVGTGAGVSVGVGDYESEETDS